MDATKRRRLEEAGWKVGCAAEFLGLSAEEAAFVEMKVELSRTLLERRMSHGWTQARLARRLGSSQSRVAKMGASDPSVSLDLLVRALLATGATPAEIGAALAAGGRPSS